MTRATIRRRVGAYTLTLALALAAGGVAVPGQGYAAADKVAAVTIGDRQFKADEMIGRSVVTPDNRKIGEVVDLIARDNTYNDVIIRLDKENRQMGLVLGDENPELAGKQSPVVLGGSTIAVRKEALEPAKEGNALVIRQSSLITVGEAGELWSTRSAR